MSASTLSPNLLISLSISGEKWRKIESQLEMESVPRENMVAEHIYHSLLQVLNSRSRKATTISTYLRRSDSEDGRP
ncbi:unnamed protein product [Victoria cruziana]